MVAENFTHFLLEYPAYAEWRQSIVHAYSQLFPLHTLRSEHAIVLAALEEGPHFHRLDNDEKIRLFNALARALWNMWQKRCAIIALAEPTANPTSGVEVTIGMT